MALRDLSRAVRGEAVTVFLAAIHGVAITSAPRVR